jgi:hypothetical protein
LNTLKMSDDSMGSATEIRTVRIPATKVAKPDLYYGDRSKLEGWLLQWDLFFLFEDAVEDHKKATLVASYMRGDAQTWVTPYLIKFLGDEDDPAIDRMFKEYLEFKDKLRQSFGTAKEPLIAERAIQRLRQHKSASDYANEFKRYSIQTDWNDAALMRMYRQGLKTTVREELMRSGVTIANLDDLITESIRLDNELYEFNLESRNFARAEAPRKTTRYHSNQGQQRSKFRPRTNGHYRSNGPEPMHLDNLTPGKPKQYSNPAWDGRKNDNKKPGSRPHDGKETRSCYGCGKPGHLSKDCRSKNKVTRQLNVLTRYTPEPDSEDNEWEVVDHDTVQHASDASTPAYAQRVRNTLSEEGNSPQNSEAEFTLDYNPVTQDEWKYAQQKKVEFGQLNTVPKPYEPTHDTLVERPNTPHPGNRVPTVWDYRMPDSESEETPLSLEKLAIDTPPASPGSKRKHPAVYPMEQQWTHDVDPEIARNMTTAQLRQCYGAKAEKTRRQTKKLGPRIRINEEYARTAHVNDDPQYSLESNDWVDRAKAAYEERHPTQKTPRTSRYLEDHRNPKHGLLSWVGCYYDNCGTHYTDKIGGGWYPQDTRRCKWQHFDCPKDTCHFHLYDKRVTGHFPGMDESEEHRTRLLINGHCTNPLWQVCMMEQCETHKAEKEANGFGTTTFLGTRLAPGINPGAATLLMPNTSSNSQ